MIQIALKLGTLTETDTVALASTILTSLPNAAGVTPNPTLPALKTLRDTAQDALDAVSAAAQALAAAVVDKDNAMDALRTGLSIRLHAEGARPERPRCHRRPEGHAVRGGVVCLC